MKLNLANPRHLLREFDPDYEHEIEAEKADQWHDDRLERKIMNYTDSKLQLALAKMLPGKLYAISNGIVSWSIDVRREHRYVHDTEWLHVCWLVEQTLKDTNESDEWSKYCILLNAIACRLHGCGNTRTCGYTIAASWQQRTIALARVKGVEP